MHTLHKDSVQPLGHVQTRVVEWNETTSGRPRKRTKPTPDIKKSISPLLFFMSLKYEPASESLHICVEQLFLNQKLCQMWMMLVRDGRRFICKILYLVIHDSGWVPLEHLLLLWYHSQRPTDTEAITIDGSI